MAMVYKASRLALVASKAQQPNGTAMAATKKTAATDGESTAKVTKVSGLYIPVPVSPEMKQFLGVSEVPRVEAVKKVWEYVKANSLQNPANKREILCDERLKGIFGQKENVNMFEVSKLISPHFLKK